MTTLDDLELAVELLDGAALAGAVHAWLQPPGHRTLEQALGLSPTVRAAFWRRRTEAAVVAAAEYLSPGASVASQANAVHAALARYAASRWRDVDRYRDQMPAAYAGRVEERLFMAMHAGGGRVLSQRSLRRMLASWPKNQMHWPTRPAIEEAPRSIEETMAQSAPEDAKKLIQLLAGTSIVKAASAERNAELTLARKGKIGEIRRLEREHLVAHPRLSAVVDARLQAVSAAQKALEVAQRLANQAIGERSSASYRYTAEHDRIEAQLRETAAPEIDDFIRDMRDLQDEAHRQFTFNETTILVSEVTERRVRQVVNNAESVAATVAACRRSIEIAEDLRLTEPDQSKVGAMLQKLRDELPTVSKELKAKAPG